MEELVRFLTTLSRYLPLSYANRDDWLKRNPQPFTNWSGALIIEIPSLPFTNKNPESLVGL